MSNSNNMTKPDYGNWVPAAMMKMCWFITVILAALELVGILVIHNIILNVIVGILFLIVLAFTLYMWRCRNIFDFNKGGLMGEVHEYLVKHLNWDGEGTLLDIGCGVEKQDFIPGFLQAPWMRSKK